MFELDRLSVEFHGLVVQCALLNTEPLVRLNLEPLRPGSSRPARKEILGIIRKS